jgi:excisionase family DNA binding protein
MPSEQLLTVSEAARWLKCSESYLNKCRISSAGPLFVRIGRSIRYRQSDLEAWAAGHVVGSTSEYGAQP